MLIIILIPQAPEKFEKPDSPMETSCSEAFSKTLLPINVADIDKDDRDNPQLVSDYVNDIYNYLRELEVIIAECSVVHFPHFSKLLLHFRNPTFGMTTLFAR